LNKEQIHSEQKFCQVSTVLLAERIGAQFQQSILKTGDVSRILVDSAWSLDSVKGARSAVKHLAKWGRRQGYAGYENGFPRRANGVILLHK